MIFHKRSTFITIIFCLLLLPGFCQQGTSPEVVVGESMGNYQFKNLINYPTTTAPISSFGHKLIILDFWSTNCGACIESWPKLLELQKQFSDRIQIILVNTHQDESIVRSIFAKRKKLAGVDVTLPTICGDTTISAMFPRLGVPHVVWVDSSHTVLSITYGTSLNAKNIAKILIDPTTSMLQKQVRITDMPWSPDKPMFVDSNGGNGEGIVYHSVLSGHVKGLVYSIAMQGNPKTGRYAKISGANVTREKLYGLAYTFETRPDGMPEEVFPNRIIFEDETMREQFSGFIDGEFSFQDFFCYELQADSSSAADLLELMQADLQRYFHHTVQVKKKKVEVYALSIVDRAKLPVVTDNQFPQGINESQFRLNGAYSMYQVLNSLRDLYYTSPHPVIDETNYSGRFYNIDLSVDTKNPDALNNALSQYGLSFKLVKREIPMIFILGPVRKVGQAN